MSAMPYDLIRSVAVIIEWENARLSELNRTRKMLNQLGRQLEFCAKILPMRSEVIILHDPDVVKQNLIQEVVTQSFMARQATAEVKIVPAPDLNYYELKNKGVGLTQNEIVVFLDSDVVPDDGWLEGLLEAFAKPEVEVVCGNTYVSLETLYSKALALFWFFPLKQSGEELIRVNQFFANNVAFRRRIIKTYSFPSLPQFRGQCLALASVLKQNGVGIFLQQKSRVEHPPPNGIKHFFSRALCDGHDTVMQLERMNETKALGLVGGCRRLLVSLRQAYWVIRKRYQEVSLSKTGASAAMGLAIAYFWISWIGEVLTRVYPSLIRRHFHV